MLKLKYLSINGFYASYISTVTFPVPILSTLGGKQMQLCFFPSTVGIHGSWSNLFGTFPCWAIACLEICRRLSSNCFPGSIKI